MNFREIEDRLDSLENTNPHDPPDDPSTNTPGVSTEDRDGHCGPTRTKFITHPLPWFSGSAYSAVPHSLNRQEANDRGELYTDWYFEE